MDFISLLTHLIVIGIVVTILTLIVWNLWMNYINWQWLNSIEWVMLEITPPKEVPKSPEAMELVLNSLFGGGFDESWYVRYWKGELAQFYSLEIASIEGNVHFYVRFHKKFRKVFEASVYAQYPQAEIKEVEDYAMKVTVPKFKQDNAYQAFGYNLILDKDEIYPIKSYIDYGLDRAIGSLDENQRIDPITPTLEIMGSIGAGEQIWIQMNIRQATKRFEVKKKTKTKKKVVKDGKEVDEEVVVETIEKGKTWKDKANQIIDELREAINKQGTKPTKGQLAVIDVIERHKNKNAFEGGIRVLYVAEKDKFNSNTVTAFTAMFRQYNTADMNSFKIDKLTKPESEPWKDMRGKGVFDKRKGFIEEYQKRAFFYGKGFDFKKLKSYFNTPIGQGKPGYILTAEELATIYHLPGQVAETPTFARIEATKSEPPANLPV